LSDYLQSKPAYFFVFSYRCNEHAFKGRVQCFSMHVVMSILLNPENKISHISILLFSRKTHSNFEKMTSHFFGNWSVSELSFCVYLEKNKTRRICANFFQDLGENICS